MRTLRALKVGLNLLHLVPGETGGSEIYARRLIPALLEAAGELELVLFASREGAPVASRRALGRAGLRGRAARACQRPRPPGPRRADAAAARGAACRGRPPPQRLHDRAGRRRRPAGDDDPRPDLQALPGGARGRPLPGDAGARRRSRRGARGGSSRSPRRPSATSSTFLGIDPGRVDVIYLGPGFSGSVEPSPENVLRRRLSLGDRPIVLSVSAHRPHKNLERLIDAIAQIEEPAVLVVPGYATRGRTSCVQHARRGAEERVRFAGLALRRGARGPLPRRRPASCSPRWPRASACRCSRR